MELKINGQHGQDQLHLVGCLFMLSPVIFSINSPPSPHKWGGDSDATERALLHGLKTKTGNH